MSSAAQSPYTLSLSRARRNSTTASSKEARLPLIAFQHQHQHQHQKKLSFLHPTIDSNSPFNSSSDTPSANFTSLLLGHIKPKPHASGATLAQGARDENIASSSSSPFPASTTGSSSPPKAVPEPSTSSSSIGKAARRGVKFSSTPLESLHSSPRHNLAHAYFPSRHQAKKSVYSSSLSSPLQFIASVDSIASPTKRVASAFDDTPSDDVAMEVEEEAPTDDEDDALTVQTLLLSSSPSSSQYSSSPTRPFPLSISFSKSLSSPSPPTAILTPLNTTFPPSLNHQNHPQGILKRSRHPILKAPNAVEGSRRNGGRRKHVLGWTDVDAAAGWSGNV
ncbi:hypothetical protein P7C70_g9213, partial [Phenoliferia sp. Uapishka_3]